MEKIQNEDWLALISTEGVALFKKPVTEDGDPDLVMDVKALCSLKAIIGHIEKNVVK